MLWLYLDFYQLTLDAALHQPLQTPMIVYHPADNRIMQCCQQAQAAGIEVGMGMAQAASLSPSLKVLNYHSDMEAQQLSAIAHQLYQIVSDIVLLPPAHLAIRLDSHLRYYNGLTPLWLTLKNELQRAGRHYHYGSGWSVESAKVLARARCNRLLAAPAAIRQQLQNTAIEHTDLTDKQKQALNRVGIRNLKTLLNLPATELGKRFHNDLIRYVCALNGSKPSPVTFFRPAENFHRHQELSYEADKTAQLIPWLHSLLNELMIFLRLRNTCTAHVYLTLHFRDEAPLKLDVRAATAMAHQKEWQALVELKIEQIVLPAPVVAIALASGTLEEPNGQSNDFFEDRFEYFNQMQLIGRLQARLGAERVLQPQEQNDYRYEPVPRAVANNVSIPALPGYPALCSPIPFPLAQPCRITYGPLRLHTGWWDEQPVCRDYYIAVTETGQYLQIFKDPGQGWFVHGWYC
ncbi:DNA polymerase Y family protein [Alteromonas aestuariivivens]|uniref:DNA polymerase Y family protein n=1 Tax=Alteromonas aestuariivivens TaxID=1938339 RepID=A0A3D8M2T3_9ALTE|nr:DNA polymerase Y family protein [Alteromonas aestuariivivens]RDV23938.1 DNA polymerase Y family protein [Alteromonas aestuariivivens]